MPPLLGVYDFTAGLPLSPPTGVLAYTVGWSHHRSWASTSSPTGLPSPPPTGVSTYTAGILCRRCWASTSSPTGWPSPPPTGVSACTAGLLCCRCWASTSSPTGRLVRRRLVSPPARLAYYAAVVGRLRLHRPAGLRRRRLVFPPARLAYYAAVVGRLRLHRPAASSAADWCHRLHGWPIMPPLLGVYVFTDRLAFAAADWCFRLHGWPIMPPLLGVYVFTDRPPRPPPTGVTACTAGLLCRRCWASTSSPTRRLVSRRLVFPPARLAIMPPLLGVYVFTDRPPRPPPTGASACTAGLLCCRCWASTSSPTGRRIRR